jgi:putative restriction endonuclease
MRFLDDVTRTLSERHRGALGWFRQNEGKDVPWPKSQGDTRLVSLAKAIYKPEWSEYALSVRQNIEGPYPDREPVVRPDSTWIYAYFQEGFNPSERDAQFTNRGLMRCAYDGVPVGVMRQVRLEPSRYRVLGLALVSYWDGGYFYLEGFSPEGVAHEPGRESEIEFETETARQEALPDFPGNIADGRRRILAAIVRRQGQPRFRAALLRLYHSRCAITGTDAIEALEAAHITPYRGTDTNTSQNGILLRSDIHTLFDLGLLSIDPRSMSVWLAQHLRDSSYRELEGRTIALPPSPDRPSIEALTAHFRWATGKPE